MNSLMPRVRWQDPGIECLLVGSGLPDELRHVKAEGVTLVGHVDELSTICKSARGRGLTSRMARRSRL